MASLAERAKYLRKCRIKRTYKDWQERGFQVMKGSKHVGRNKGGECLFYKTQTKPKVRHPGQYHDDNDYNEDCWWFDADIGDK